MNTHINESNAGIQEEEIPIADTQSEKNMKSIIVAIIADAIDYDLWNGDSLLVDQYENENNGAQLERGNRLVTYDSEGNVLISIGKKDYRVVVSEI